MWSCLNGSSHPFEKCAQMDPTEAARKNDSWLRFDPVNGRTLQASAQPDPNGCEYMNVIVTLRGALGTCALASPAQVSPQGGGWLGRLMKRR